jgi:epoxyqueuosine reductase QueG
MDTAEVKQKAKEFGADLLGIASPERFASVKPQRSPLAVFPDMKSALVVGRRILRGAMRGVEEGTNFHSTYSTFGYRWLEDNFLARTTYDLTCWLETQGFEAVPLFGYCEDGMPTGVPVAPGKPEPNVIVDMDYAAHAAGLGEIGLGGFFLTPEYGTRQRFALILTDAKLDADPIRDKSICSDCGACVAACPLQAIDASHLETVGVPGHQIQVAHIDYEICNSCPNGAMKGPGRGTRPDRCAAACGRMCLTKLEGAGKCGNTFAQTFRKRTPWALDSLKRPVPVAGIEAGCDQKYAK